MPIDPSNSNQKQSTAAPRAWVSLGGNIAFEGLIGGPLFEAVLAVLAKGGFQTARASGIWMGPAWPVPSDPPYYNAVVQGAWRGGASDLLALLLETELAFGRRRSVRNAPRTLDLDLLDLEGGRGRFKPDLVVPHPRLSFRPFILGPLSEAAPEWRHPDSGLSARELFEVSENKGKYCCVAEKLLKAPEITANP